MKIKVLSDLKEGSLLGQGFQFSANVWIFSFHRTSLGTLTLLNQTLGQNAELLAVDERLPVRVVGRRHEERVDLVLAVGATLHLKRAGLLVS